MVIGTIINAIWCALVKFVNALTEHVLDNITEVAAWIIDLLPEIPWEFEPLEWGEFGNLIGYFLPIAKMLTHFTYMLGIVTVWYGVQHILRIIRLVK